VEASDTQVTPPLLTCLMTNIFGDLYEGTLPSPSEVTFNKPVVRKFKLLLTFSLLYEPNVAGNGIEVPHSIHIYPTQGFFIGKKHCVLIIDPNIDPSSESVAFEVAKSFSVASAFIPKSAALNIDVYAT